jgi:hypothetical protein
MQGKGQGTMTDYKMTEEMRKLLTEKLLGGCWHEPISLTACTCQRTGIVNSYIHCSNMNRTFTTDANMMAVFRKIRDKGKWADFINYARIAYKNSFNLLWKYVWEEKFTEWLFLDNPERACCLAAMFLEEQK